MFHLHKSLFSISFALAVLCLSTISSPLRAQWVQTSMPYRGYVRALAASSNGAGGTMLVAGTDGGGVYISTNDGTDWKTADSGLTSLYVWSLAITSNGSGGTNIFAGTYDKGVFLSTNEGAKWQPIDSGLTCLYVTSLAATPNGSGGNLLFAGTDSGGVYLSTNNGAIWTARDSDLAYRYVWSVWASPNGTGGTNLIAGTDGGGAFFSTNNGAIWTTTDSTLTNPYVYALELSGGTLFAGTDSGMFLLNYNDSIWTGYPIDSNLTDFNILSLALVDTNVFAGTAGDGVYLTTNDGATWAQVNDGLTANSIWSLVVSGSNLFAGSYGDGIWRLPLSSVLSVKRASNGLPAQFRLEQNYPNPFNPTTTIEYALSKSAYVRLVVYDLLGRKVAVLVNGMQTPGYKSATFDGSQLSSGVYLYRIEAGSYTATKKLLLLK